MTPVDRLRNDLGAIFSMRLVSLVVYGGHPSGTAAGDVPIHTLALVDSLSFPDLDACGRVSSRWMADGLAVPLIISGLNEVKVRGARTIVIAEEDARLRANSDDLIVLPKSDPQISALLGVLPLQLLSYHMSVMRGFDPDFPRNLSKTLTVD